MLGKDDKKNIVNDLSEKEKDKCDIKDKDINKTNQACRKITFNNVSNKDKIKSNRNNNDKEQKILDKIEAKLSNQMSDRTEKINENENEQDNEGETLSISNLSDENQKLKATSSTASDSKGIQSNRERKISNELPEIHNLNKESP